MSFQQDEKVRFLSQMDIIKNTVGHTPEDKRNWKPADSCMCSQEMMNHLTGSNHFFSAMFQGKEPPQPPAEPPQLTFEQSLSAFEESSNMLADVIASVPDEALGQDVPLPNGRTANMKFMLTIPGNHMAYHWGQLAYMQTIWGDKEDHFFDPSFEIGSRYK